MAYSFPQIARRALDAIQQANQSQALELTSIGIDNLLNEEDAIFNEVDTLTSLLQLVDMMDTLMQHPQLHNTDASWEKSIQTIRHLAEQTLIGNESPLRLKTQLQTLKEQLHSLHQSIQFLEQHQSFEPSTATPNFYLDLNAQQNIYLTTKLVPQELTVSEAMELQHNFLQIADDHSQPANRLFNVAIQLLLAGDYSTAIEKLTLTQKEYPEINAICYTAIGAAYFYLQSYEAAIESYLLAKQYGEESERVEFNIWEAYQALVTQSTTLQEKMRWKFMYEDLFPNKNYEISL